MSSNNYKPESHLLSPCNVFADFGIGGQKSVSRLAQLRMNYARRPTFPADINWDRKQAEEMSDVSSIVAKILSCVISIFRITRTGMIQRRHRCSIAQNLRQTSGKGYKSAKCKYFHCAGERDALRNWTLCLEMTSLCWFVTVQLSGTKGFNLLRAPPLLLRWSFPNTLSSHFISVCPSLT